MMNHIRIVTAGLLAVSFGVLGLNTPEARGDVYNLRVVTDASPDYTDLDSLVHSTTSRWESDRDKMWALFYWNHKSRRQTNPMTVHGKHETDPIRQANDYGFQMCSTISGVKIAIWQHMGYPARYWDITLHTVPEVFYDGRWHMYDNSLTGIYTLCDGHTIAGVEDIGATLGCEASGGKEERGHIAIYHALHGTSVDGFLEGADTMRELRDLGQKSFNPNGLKFRDYVTYAERGHRYILNMREGEVYTRHYERLDKTDSREFESDPAYFTPNGETGSGEPRDPEAKNPRYRIRGNGVRTFTPQLTEQSLPRALHSYDNIAIVNGGLRPARAGEPAEAIFKVEGANVITSMNINAETLKTNGDNELAIAISTTNGVTWTDIYNEDETAGTPEIRLIDEVNGAYEVLVKVHMMSHSQPEDVLLRSINFETITQINSKTQPQLNIGRNTVYVGAGEQTGSIVIWPELQNDAYMAWAHESVNVRTREKHEGWNGVMRADDTSKPGYIIFKVDAPHDITRITQGARMYVRHRGAEIAFEHSFDGGETWHKSYSFTDTEMPWDDIHHEVMENIPAGTRSVLFKYVMNNASLYSIRMEVNHEVPVEGKSPVEVTFNWSERQQDYSLIERSHTQLVETFPFTYTINVGGADHPVVNSLTVNPKGARGELAYGYSDGKDAGGEKWMGNWVTYGRNFAEGKPYTLSIPPAENNWGAGDPDGTKLTDGRVGSSYSGGTSYREGALWTRGQNPVITVDLGEPKPIRVFRIHIHGYPGQDAIRGQVQDTVEVLVSNDGENFTSKGFFDFNLRWKDVPVNYMYTDEESFRAHNHTLLLEEVVEARYVRFDCAATRFMTITEVQALDGMSIEPFDLKVALPADAEKAIRQAGAD